CARDPRLGDYW
nr:immunoglobulin heavy chain junction region [Mus musculus]MBK4188952.1 immunoglobulin heavy chain junction region [Mus musculus]MBK4188953.1 immunoglobulin heavy chain junction region [Mus musculus]MBK4188954.1 immunoglobulin heavy chain junction region [Mus musculus]MBK4188955.1 immunoglobulin heavy chain junction region [Mus musculus]